MEASTVSQSRLIGDLLVEKNVITSEQLEEALLLQEESGERIGEIAVARFGASRAEIAGVLAEQWAGTGNPGSKGALEAVEPLTPAEVRLRRPLGQILVDDGIITREQLDAALAVQSKSGAQIGQILVEHGALSPLDLATALAEQGMLPKAGSLPSRDGSPSASTSSQGWSAHDLAVIADLEDRLQVIERAAGGTPWQEDLRFVSFDLRAALNAVEERLTASATNPASLKLTEAIEAVTTRLDALESAPAFTGFDALRQELEALKTLPAPAEGVSELRAAVERLENQTDRADEMPQLSNEIAVLAARLDELAGLANRLDDVTAHLPAEGLVEDIDRMIAERVAQAVGDDAVDRSPELASLVARLDQLAARVDGIAALSEPDTAPLDEIRARIDDLAAGVAREESVGVLESRVDELEHRLVAATPAAELREDIQEIVESSVGEQESLLQALATRVAEIAATAPREGELQALQAQLDGLAARPAEDYPLHARVDDLSARLEEIGAVEAAVAALAESLTGLDAQRAYDEHATGARLEGLQAAIDSLAGLELRVRESVDPDLSERIEALGPRHVGADIGLDRVEALDERVAGLAAELERRPDGEALAVVAAELRAELAALADGAALVDLDERLVELSQRIDGSARAGNERIDGLAEELGRRVGGLERELGHRLDDIAARADDLVSRDEAAAIAAEQAAWVQSELDVLRTWTGVRADAVDAELARADQARKASQQELERRIDEAVGGIRGDLDVQGDALEARLAANANETAALRARIDQLQEAAAVRAAWETRLEGMLEQRLGGLASRITDEVAGARLDAEQALEAVFGETGSLGARIDELRGLHQADAQAARVASEQLAERVESLAGLRVEDLAAVGRASADVAARLDDHEVRSAAAAREVEETLRGELRGLVARFEEQDMRGMEEHDELRGRVDRAAGSVGWRLDRIEESLASGNSAKLGHDPGGQAVMREAQVRVTEDAVRGAPALPTERPVDRGSPYVNANDALRRSIERLGAAVAETDSRVAKIPVSRVAGGWLAFAPTAAGYRLIELPGAPPELGSTIVLGIEGCEDGLVVTRYGDSPLPLDGRPCAFLDRA